jgi:hypothetical protein
MHIERETRGISEGVDYTGPKCQVRHELAIHDIAMDQFSASLLGFFRLLSEPAEVGGQHRWGDAYLDESPHMTCFPAIRPSRETAGCVRCRTAPRGERVACSAGVLPEQYATLLLERNTIVSRPRRAVIIANKGE